jgi:GMP synthase (glutamine-hydrolysing)
MKPFLLLQSRPEQPAADNEYEAMMKFGGLKPAELHRLAMDRDGLSPVNLDDYAGVILGGGPSNVSDPEAKKSPAQKRFEQPLFELIQEIVRRDFPFLGACLGVGIVAAALDGKVSRTYGEPVGPVAITLTPEAAHDPLLQGLPPTFQAFVGHKEACDVLPTGAVLLASSPTCPIQMYRLGQNVYATQFHPELDAQGLALRIKIYQHAGYFDPSEVEKLTAIAHSAVVTEPTKILRQFVTQYAHQWARA